MYIKKIATVGLAVCTALLVSTIAALAQVATVTVSELNVRSGPGAGFDVTFVLRQGDRVEIIKRQGEWAFVVGERGGEGWVFARYLSTSAPAPTPTPAPTPAPPANDNQVYRGNGNIENARFRGAGMGTLVINSKRNDGSLLLTGTGGGGGFSVEYIGRLRSVFEGTVQIDITQFRSSEMGFRTVQASGSCELQTREGVNLVRAFCTVKGSGIDHGRSSFTAR